MLKYQSLTYQVESQVNLNKYKYIKVPAIRNNCCFRCGYQNCIDMCPNCKEFGVLYKGTNLYCLDTYFTNPIYKKESRGLIFTDLQKECSNKMIENYKSGNNLLIWAVCGAGKTEITFPAIEEALIARKNICFAIPRIDILYDVYERLVWYFPNVDIAILNSKEPKYKDAQIYVITTNQILKFKNAFDICIVDEVDAYPYEHNQKFDYGVNASLTKNGVIFYLTSTPSKALLNRVDQYFTINRRWHGFDLPVPKLRYLGTEMTNFRLPNLELLIRASTAKRQQLWFVANIQFGIKLLNIYSKFSNRKIQAVHANDPMRREKIIAFQNGEIDILITTTILERGVTFEDIDVLVIDSSNPMYNKAALVQIAGRVGRKKDFQDGVVYFYHQGVTTVITDAINDIKKMNGMG